MGFERNNIDEKVPSSLNALKSYTACAPLHTNGSAFIPFSYESVELDTCWFDTTLDCSRYLLNTSLADGILPKRLDKPKVSIPAKVILQFSSVSLTICAS